ncbi:TolC family outer membrane protein [Cobetia marina]|jgi:adhesin transport system outer membrane protein|uniref:TolC family outer membrane protein n=1 Tax=Cobetia marina TaxID=28258 RepID=A0ABU9GI53_COBMA|nr:MULTISPECIES: TolC family outer membrane protein [Cobetia]MDA5564780.1 TolC family outer membrane protein [Cobetia sp. MMG027]MDH2292708.1 TolC family outer membrane protein [Cobetia sp. 10Alg 146]MDI6003035.1 TolC family outer membrane protein [Cobetia pacifica]MDN2657535.1 TolC family outer membrane protein [Cobetia sp. 14N.309.X.WAT.E.A4]MDO6788792.1 TolC family outer membrane protein [Cobetia marina]
MKKTLLALSVMAGMSSSLSASAQSLEEAVSKAVMENPRTRLQVTRHIQRLEEAEVQRGAYRPTVDLTGRLGYGKFDSEDDGVNDEDDWHDYRRLDLTIRQLLWDGDTTIERIRQAETEADYQRLQTAAEANDVALDTAGAYLDVMRDELILKYAQANLDAHRRISSDIGRRAESGLGARSDVRQVDGRLANAEASVLSARNNLEDSRSAYLRLVGELPTDLNLPSLDTDLISADVESAYVQANQRNPLLAAARVSIDAARHEVNAEKGDNYPEFSIEGNRTLTDDYDQDESSSDDWSVELVMRYNLYRGGRDQAEIRGRQAALETVEHDNDRVMRDVRDEIRLAWNARENLKRQIDYLESYVRAATDTRESYRKQFDIGRRTLLDLLDSESELFTSQQNLIRARFDLETANYRLLSATGALLDSMNVAVPTRQG